MGMQASLPQLLKSVERGLSLLAKGELVDALQVFDAQLKVASDTRSPTTHILKGLAELCQIKLKLPITPAVAPQPPAKKPRTAPPSRTSAGTSHPLHHLLDALRSGSGAANTSMRKGLGVSGYREQRAADARAAGHALAFLLHPAVHPIAVPDEPAASGTQAPAAAVTAATAGLPKCLIDEALTVLASKGKSAFSSTSASPLLSEGSSNDAGSAGRSEQEVLRKRAKGSKVLLELLELTGLEPVKQAMLNLADQVGPLEHVPAGYGVDAISVGVSVRPAFDL